MSDVERHGGRRPPVPRLWTLRAELISKRTPQFGERLGIRLSTSTNWVKPAPFLRRSRYWDTVDRFRAYSDQHGYLALQSLGSQGVLERLANIFSEHLDWLSMPSVIMKQTEFAPKSFSDSFLA